MKSTTIILIRMGILVLLLISISKLTYAQSTPKALFELSDTLGCSPLKVYFINKSTGATKFYWSFGNGTTSTLNNPSSIYTNVGKYTISLIAENSLGITDTFTWKNAVNIVVQPKVNFDANIKAMCPGTSISFTNTSTNANKYVWDFGDGNISKIANPQHSYTQSGYYTVKLIGENNFGCRVANEKKSLIYVYAKPNMDFSADVTNLCDSNKGITLTATGSGNIKWKWYFGDGKTSFGRSSTHIYGKTGIFTVSLVAYNFNGCTDSIALKDYILIRDGAKYAITASNKKVCNNGSVILSVFGLDSVKNITWDFGDGVTSKELKPIHTYTKSGSYSISVKFVTLGGCQVNLLEKSFLNVAGASQAAFTGQGRGCVPYTLTFTDASTGAVAYNWDFGDGQTSSLKNPNHTYTKSGIYSVTLSITGTSGCFDLVKKDSIILVDSLPIAYYSPDKYIGCPPLRVIFENKSQNMTSYKWDFGDGKTSMLKSPTHIFTSEGQFRVKLWVINNNGCSSAVGYDTIIDVKNVNPNYQTPPPIYGCLPYSTQFTDASGNKYYRWDFGDGDTSVEKSPKHKYTKNGTYKVSLKVRNYNGCPLEFPNYQTVIVRDLETKFSFKQDDCPPHLVKFSDSTLGATSWYWDFGDGTSSTERHPSHNYKIGGKYKVNLTTMTPEGCTNSDSATISFTTLFANPEPKIAQNKFPSTLNFKANAVGANTYSWDFGDNSQVSNLENPTHTYIDSANYKIRLTISNGICTVVYRLSPFVIPKPPTPIVPNKSISYDSIYMSSNKGCAPFFVQFRDYDSTATAWVWQFGDGKTSNTRTPVHLYNTPGNYTVTLTRTTSSGDKVFKNIVSVTDPKSKFKLHVLTSVDKTQVICTDSSSSGNDWLWSFGDNGISTEQNPSHTYLHRGLDSIDHFNIVQNVADFGGCSNKSSQIVMVGYPTNMFTFGASQACVGKPIFTTHKFTYIDKWVWDFGDGNTSLDSHAMHIYTQVGTYQVSLNLYDKSGNKYTYVSKDSVVVKDPQADFQVLGQHIGCDTVRPIFKNLSIGANSYEWNFGDSTALSNDSVPMHIYTKPGVYDVTLKAKYGNCTSVITSINAVTVLKPRVDFTHKQSEYCFPITVNYTNTSKGTVYQIWDFGDGFTSTEANPVHIFKEKPTKPVSITVEDSNGCVTTVKKKGYEIVTSLFAVDDDGNCGQKPVKFANKSQHATEFLWDFGDGTTSTDSTPAHQYVNPGKYIVKLRVKGTGTCIDTFTLSDTLKIGKPKIGFYVDNVSDCAPAVIQFFDTSTAAYRWRWEFGDNVSSDLKNPAHIYNKAGKYTVKLIVYNISGCSDTLIKEDFITILGPNTHFGISDIVTCQGLPVSFLDSSINAIRWEWNFGDGNSSNEKNPVFSYTEAGVYTVTLISWDKTGCYNSFTLDSAITVLERNELIKSTIKSVSILDDKTLKLSWKASTNIYFKSYNVYMRNDIDRNWKLKSVVSNINQVELIFDSLDTRNRIYDLVIQTVDRCGLGLSLAELNYHSSINIKSETIGTNVVNVSWSPYQGATPKKYLLYKTFSGNIYDELNTKTVFVDSIKGGITTYIDYSNYCPDKLQYRVVAELQRDSIFAFSDTTVSTTGNAFAKQNVNVVRSSTISDYEIMTEWKFPDTLANQVNMYIIERSEDSGSHWNFVGTANRSSTMYIDRVTDANKTKYLYRVLIENVCHTESAIGGYGNNIILSGVNSRDIVRLKWSAYTQWKSGVDKYIIERQEPDGTWKILNEVGSTIFEAKDSE